MSRQRTLTLVAAAVVVLGAGGAALAARSADDGSAAAPRAQVSSAPPQRVIQPGRPGEPATVTDSDQVTAPPGATFNSIDTTFVQMMIVHHAQAVTMAKLAPGRAGDARLRALADRMAAAQAPEITWMRGWLRDRRQPESNTAHDHRTMPGMQSDADMTALAGLTGPAFDRKFVAMMTAHHKGALRMAGDMLGGGTDQQLYEFANELAVEQGSEIRRMEQLGVK